MGYVEHAGVGAHGFVFGDLRTIMDGQLPAGKIDQLRACILMGLVKRGGFRAVILSFSGFIVQMPSAQDARKTLSVLEPEIFGRIRMMANQSAHCFARLSEWWFRRPSPLRWTLL